MDQFCEKKQYNFLIYISSGFELNFMVAVDFTGKIFHMVEEFYFICVVFFFIFLVVFFLVLNVLADDLFML